LSFIVESMMTNVARRLTFYWHVSLAAGDFLKIQPPNLFLKFYY